MVGKTCTSCKKAVENDKGAASFACPACGEGIIRCGNCRKTSAPYTCSCGFGGP